MKNAQHVFCTFLLSLGLISGGLYAQEVEDEEKTTVEILNSEDYQFQKTDSGQLETLTGDIHLRNEDVDMFADLAHIINKFEQVNAFGNVVIIQPPNTRIVTDTLYYDGFTNLMSLHGNVELTDEGMNIKTNELFYDINEKKAFYVKSGILNDGTSTLTSVKGTYYSETKKSYFRDDVVLIDKDNTVRTDSMDYDHNTGIADFFGPTEIDNGQNIINANSGFYDTVNEIAEFGSGAQIVNETQTLQADDISFDQNTGIGIASGHVFWTDSVENISIISGFAKYNQNDSSIIATIDPIMIQIIDGDSLFIKADTLISEKIDEHRFFTAFRNVKIYKSDFQSTADSVYYSYEDSIFRLFYDPVLWVDSTQLIGDTIRILTENQKITEIQLMDNASIISRTANDVFDQIQGRTINGYLENNELHTVHVDGNGETIYFALDDNDGFIGINQAICSRMDIYIIDSKVDNINFYIQPDASFSPVQPNNLLQYRLSDFSWKEEMRPWRTIFLF